jgi:amino acid transporter
MEKGITMSLGTLGVEHFAMLIPIVSIMGGITIAIVAIVMAARKKELEHKERIIAMEKGIEIPIEPPKEEKRRPKHRTHRTSGLVVTFVGIALSFAMYVSGGPEAGVWGLPILAVGLGLLVSSFLERKDEGAEGQPTTGGA